MRKQEVVEIAGQSITLYEITVADVLGAKERMDNLTALVEYFLPRCTDTTAEALQLLAFSELETLWDKFKEVNAAFFRLAGMIGLPDVLALLADEIRGTLITLSMYSLRQATEPLSTATAGTGSAAV